MYQNLNCIKNVILEIGVKFAKNLIFILLEYHVILYLNLFVFRTWLIK